MSLCFSFLILTPNPVPREAGHRKSKYNNIYDNRDSNRGKQDREFNAPAPKSHALSFVCDHMGDAYFWKYYRSYILTVQMSPGVPNLLTCDFLVKDIWSWLGLDQLLLANIQYSICQIAFLSKQQRCVYPISIATFHSTSKFSAILFRFISCIWMNLFWYENAYIYNRRFGRAVIWCFWFSRFAAYTTLSFISEYVYLSTLIWTVFDTLRPKELHSRQYLFWCVNC